MHMATVKEVALDTAGVGYLLTIEFLAADHRTKTSARFKSVDLNRLFRNETLGPLLGEVWKEHQWLIETRGTPRDLVGQSFLL